MPIATMATLVSSPVPNNGIKNGSQTMIGIGAKTLIRSEKRLSKR